MIKIKNRVQRAFIALTLSFLPVFFAADLAHAEEESAQVSVTISLNEQVTQAEIIVANASSEIQVVTQDLASTSDMVQQLIGGGSSDLASVSEVISLATVAVAEASAALASASEALWDAKEKQESYQAAVAANELATSNLTAAQSSYNQAVIDLSSISASVSAQQQVVQQEQSELNALQNQPSNSYEASSPGWTNSVEASTSTGSTTTLPPMWDSSTKIDVPFDIKMGNTLYEGQGSASQIYVTSKAFISFGQPDHTFWDWPQTTGIYVYQSDWMTAGAGAYTKITTTENTLKVEWSLHRFGDSNGPLTNVVWNMTVDPITGEWAGYSEISGNTSNLYGGPRIGVRYSNGGAIQTMSPKILDSVSAEIIAQQQQVVASESLELVNLQTQQTLQTSVVQSAGQTLALANSASSQANSIEIQALNEFTQALQNTQNIVNNLVIVVDNAETKTQTAYVVVTNAIANLPTPSPQPEPVQPTPEPSTPTEPVVEPTPEPEPTLSPEVPTDPEPETPVEPTPEPETPTEPKPEPITPETPTEPEPETPLEPEPETPVEPEPVDPEPTEPEEITPETPITEEAVNELLSENFEPTTLTEEQIEQVKELANKIFANSEPGSDAYEQALDLLMVAAEADDIQLPEELAAIPLIGNVAATTLEIFNNVGNIGADMSPEVRETAEKTVIASVIAAQAAISAVASATATTASSGTRRI